MNEICRQKAISEEYVDFIWQTDFSTEKIQELYPDVCVQPINHYFSVFYANKTYLQTYSLEYGYDIFPTLYTLLETESLEASRILQLQNQPVLQLKGEGVLIGFIDTGVDYTNRCFRDAAGNSRILEIWDQTIQEGQPPEGIFYGSVYTGPAQ